MKTTKFLFALFMGAMMLIASCDDDPNIIIEYPDDYVPTDSGEVAPPQPEIKKQPIAENIIGEWVADYAINDPQGYRWEILKFLDQNVMYFSNYSEIRATAHSYENGTYTIGDTTITTNCQLGWAGGTTQYNTEMRISYIDAYKMTADIWHGGEMIASNTYQKVVGSIDIEKGDVLPDYAQMLGGQTARSFSSHNPYVATVDEQGRIASQWSGSTYIDITTDQGTAALQVNVNSIFYFDYEDYLGASMKEVVNVFEQQTSTDKNVMIYKYNDSYYPALQRKSGNWESMRVRLNPTTALVDAITIYAREDIKFTDYQINDYLEARYNVYQRMPEDVQEQEQGIPALDDAQKTGNKTYYVGKTMKDAKVGVTWSESLKAIRFVDLTDSPKNIVDFGHLIGMSWNDVTSIMGTPLFSNENEWMVFPVAGKYANMVKLSFKNRDTKKIKKTVQEVVVYLYTDIDMSDVVSVLDEKYEYDSEVVDTRLYSCSSPKMLVDVWLGNTTTTKLIQYVYRGIDIDDDGPWPDYAALALNSIEDVMGAMGEPVETANDQITFHTSWFMGVFMYYDINGNDYVGRVALNRHLRWSAATNILAYLKDGIKAEEVTSILGNKYSYQEKESVPVDGVYVYKTTIRYIDIWIEYNTANGAICYYRK